MRSTNGGASEDPHAVPLEPLSAAGAARAAARTSSKELLAAINLGRQIARHDVLAGRIYEDRINWVRDEDKKLRKNLREADERLNKENLYWSGHRFKVHDEFCDDLLHRWRDRNLEAERASEDIYSKENLSHTAWRRFRSKPSPRDPHADEIARTVAGWKPLPRPEDYRIRYLIRFRNDPEARGDFSSNRSFDVGDMFIHSDRGIDRQARVVEIADRDPATGHPILVCEWVD
jgi:hypothetical protein